MAENITIACVYFNGGPTTFYTYFLLQWGAICWIYYDSYVWDKSDGRSQNGLVSKDMNSSFAVGLRAMCMFSICTKVMHQGVYALRCLSTKGMNPLFPEKWTFFSLSSKDLVGLGTEEHLESYVYDFFEIEKNQIILINILLYWFQYNLKFQIFRKSKTNCRSDH